MTKDLVTNPNKMSQPAGAALAFMGVKGMIPLWHGVQGCTAFAKVLLISHFREPMPFVNTAISQTNVIMGGDENIAEALINIKSQGDVVGLITTGVAETSGVDLKATILDFQKTNPECKVVFLNTPDYEGNLSSGYAKATQALLRTLVKPRAKDPTRQVAIFPGPYITPGEVESLREIIQDFSLDPVFCPDLGDSLYGYLREQRFSPCTTGGVEVNKLAGLSESCLALSIGPSMESLTREFGQAHQIPVLHYNNLIVLEEIDHFLQTLSWIADMPVPQKYHRQRQHYMDTLLDTDFHFHGKKVAIAGDTDFVKRWKDPLDILEMETLGITNKAEPGLEVGDYSDLVPQIIDHKVDFVIGNSHMASIAEEIKIPVLRSGIPVTDRFGEPQSVRIGYNGASRMLRECANVIMKAQKHKHPYISDLSTTLI